MTFSSRPWLKESRCRRLNNGLIALSKLIHGAIVPDRRTFEIGFAKAAKSDYFPLANHWGDAFLVQHSQYRNIVGWHIEHNLPRMRPVAIDPVPCE